MGIFETAKEFGKMNTVDPFKRISAKVGAADVWSKPGMLVAEGLKEGLVEVPVRNIVKITSLTAGAVFKLLGKTAKLGLSAAMLIPLPVIGSGAQLKGSADAFKHTIELKARGNTENFKDLYAKIRGVRDEAKAQAIPADTAA